MINFDNTNVKKIKKKGTSEEVLYVKKKDESKASWRRDRIVELDLMFGNKSDLDISFTNSSNIDHSGIQTNYNPNYPETDKQLVESGLVGFYEYNNENLSITISVKSGIQKSIVISYNSNIFTSVSQSSVSTLDGTVYTSYIITLKSGVKLTTDEKIQVSLYSYYSLIINANNSLCTGSLKNRTFNYENATGTYYYTTDSLHLDLTFYSILMGSHSDVNSLITAGAEEYVILGWNSAITPSSHPSNVSETALDGNYYVKMFKYSQNVGNEGYDTVNWNKDITDKQNHTITITSTKAYKTLFNNSLDKGDSLGNFSIKLETWLEQMKYDEIPNNETPTSITSNCYLYTPFLSNGTSSSDCTRVLINEIGTSTYPSEAYNINIATQSHGTSSSTSFIIYSNETYTMTSSRKSYTISYDYTVVGDGDHDLLTNPSWLQTTNPVYYGDILHITGYGERGEEELNCRTFYIEPWSNNNGIRGNEMWFYEGSANLIKYTWSSTTRPSSDFTITDNTTIYVDVVYVKNKYKTYLYGGTGVQNVYITTDNSGISDLSASGTSYDYGTYVYGVIELEQNYYVDTSKTYLGYYWVKVTGFENRYVTYSSHKVESDYNYGTFIPDSIPWYDKIEFEFEAIPTGGHSGEGTDLYEVTTLKIKNNTGHTLTGINVLYDFYEDANRSSYDLVYDLNTATGLPDRDPWRYTVSTDNYYRTVGNATNLATFIRSGFTDIQIYLMFTDNSNVSLHYIGDANNGDTKNYTFPIGSNQNQLTYTTRRALMKTK